MIDLKKSWMIQSFIFISIIALFAPNFGCSKGDEQYVDEASKLKATLVYYTMPG